MALQKNDFTDDDFFDEVKKLKDNKEDEQIVNILKDSSNISDGDEILQNITKMYFNRIKEYNLLTKEKEFELFSSIERLRDEITTEILNNSYLFTEYITMYRDNILKGVNIKNIIVIDNSNEQITPEFIELVCTSIDNFLKNPNLDTFKNIQLINNKKLEIFEKYETLLNTIIKSIKKNHTYDISQLKINADNISLEQLYNQIKKIYKNFLEKKQEINEIENIIIKSNFRLVVSLAKRYNGKNKQGLSMLDIIMEGITGLKKAIQKFNCLRGFKFSTYCSWWATQAITRSMSDYDPAIRHPSHLKEQLNTIQREFRRLVNVLGRDPTPEEIAEATNVKLNKIMNIISIGREAVSLNKPIKNEEGSAVAGDYLVSHHSDDLYVDEENREMKHKLFTSLSSYGTILEKVTRMKFLDLKDQDLLENISIELNIPKEKVRHYLQVVFSSLKNEGVGNKKMKVKNSILKKKSIKKNNKSDEVQNKKSDESNANEQNNKKKNKKLDINELSTKKKNKQ